jgi:hypothetical protein
MLRERKMFIVILWPMEDLRSLEEAHEWTR